jgi:nitrite reductase/ring-hydroxylating ferredoxin subunit
MASRRLQTICRSYDVSDPGSREFQIHRQGEIIHGLVVHWHGQWYAYVNRCPHTGVTLNWLPDQFFDVDMEYLQCGTHGALFQPQDGLCVYGPCVGRSLTCLAVVRYDDEIAIDCINLDPA